MSILTLGSLCSGYGGLDIAAEQLLDARTIWCAEFEDAPSRVLEARFPDVPNVHDVKRIPWWIMAPIDVMTAGYPCQPFSLAGARKGEDDERHLWPSIAEGIRIMRPRHVLLENVRGHLSLGFDQVLHDLNALGYAVVWRILAASAVGACHRRERLWIYAQPAKHVKPGVSPVLAVAGPEGWLDAEEDLFGDRLPWSGKLPPAGVMHSGEIRAISMPQPAVEGPLFPTPNAQVSNDGEGPETWLARREKVKARGINGNGMGMPLSIAVQLLPTTTAADAHSSGGSCEANTTLTAAIGRTDFGTKPNERLLPTPKTTDSHHSSPADANRRAPGMRAIAALLPTPDAYQGSRGGSQDPEKRRAGGHTVSLADVLEKGADLLPTPRSSDASHGGPNQRDSRGGLTISSAVQPARWGKYAAAIDRHTLILGRDAPAPTQPNSKGNPELAAPFEEWMMCLPAGWVTDPTLWSHLTPRKAREAQLKMLGNGVVWVCALAAYRSLATVAAPTREAVAA
ncbi:DNA cytosine methyltransferase [Leucobacter sp.]